MRSNYTNDGFKAKPAPANLTDREAKVLAYWNPVSIVEKHLISRAPRCVTLDDLKSAGTIGLIQAIDRFDAKHGVAFNSYAKHRILGAMLDYLRGDDPLSRIERQPVLPHGTEPRARDHQPRPVQRSLPGNEDKGVVPNQPSPSTSNWPPHTAA